jgi:hypothetical protein
VPREAAERLALINNTPLIAEVRFDAGERVERGRASPG